MNKKVYHKIMINFLKFFQKTEEQKTAEFFKKYRKLSKKYNRDFIAVLSIFKDGKVVDGDEEISEYHRWATGKKIRKYFLINLPSGAMVARRGFVMSM